ncbi:MAG: glycosyltransferase [Actinobacteria bacterium]|nr:MAG: glycosyltransferase [Actinomycetota bacterium]
MPARFSIAHVTPYPWEERADVNLFVERVTGELAERGHRPLVIAPSRSQAVVRRSRQALRRLREDPDALLQGRGLEVTAAGVPLVAVGEVLDVPGAAGRRGALPIDVARTVEELLVGLASDFVHVHEPFAPSTASAALRHSRSLNVGSFHAPTERVVSTQLARKVVELFFGRLDARTASFAATAELMRRYFPGEYRVVLPGADPPAADGRASAKRSAAASRVADHAGPVRIAFAEEEERPAQRVLLRALRRLPLEPGWEVTVLTERGASSSTPLRAELRERVRVVSAAELSEDELLDWADVLVCASDGAAPAPGLLLRGLAAGAVPVASRLPAYEEALAEGGAGLLFEPRDVEVLAGQLGRLIADPELRARLVKGAAESRASLTWRRVADELEDVYGQVAARRKAPPADGALRRRLASRAVIDVDLHMHTDHSHDCATPVEVLLATARQQRLGAIAVTDHNEISGALSAAAQADGLKVIVAEEIKTASQGEVIGLFLSERIERGLDLAETIAQIRHQGGLVYVPHPFDRLHAVPDYEHLLGILDEIDAIEVFNPRVAIGSFNEEAARFAAKYRIPAGAGSDSHVPQGLGSVRVRMRDFDGPEEFLASLREADIVTRPTSLLYVQALKFLQTKARPQASRQASRRRRARRALRNS